MLYWCVMQCLEAHHDVSLLQTVACLLVKRNGWPATASTRKLWHSAGYTSHAMFLFWSNIYINVVNSVELNVEELTLWCYTGFLIILYFVMPGTSTVFWINNLLRESERDIMFDGQ